MKLAESGPWPSNFAARAVRLNLIKNATLYIIGDTETSFRATIDEYTVTF